MGRSFVLHIPGEVGAKGRPRSRIITPHGGKPFVSIYPDPDSAREERMVKGLAYAELRGQAAFVGPVELTIEVFRNHPKSWSRQQREANSGFYITGKPDLDNLAKLIGDALNGVVYEDDKQISDLIVRRRFITDSPSVVVTVTELVRADNDLFVRSGSH